MLYFFLLNIRYQSLISPFECIHDFRKRDVGMFSKSMIRINSFLGFCIQPNFCQKKIQMTFKQNLQ